MVLAMGTDLFSVWLTALVCCNALMPVLASEWPNPVKGFTRGKAAGVVGADSASQADHDFSHYYRVEALDLLLIARGWRQCAPHNVEDTEHAVAAAQRNASVAVDPQDLSPAFWESITVPIRPGQSSAAVLALKWLLNAADEPSRPPLWNSRAVARHECTATFDADLENRFVEFWGTKSSGDSGRRLNSFGVMPDQWQELLARREVRSAAGCPGRAIVSYILGEVFTVVWVVFAVLFVIVYSDGNNSWTFQRSSASHSLTSIDAPRSPTGVAKQFGHPRVSMLGVAVGLTIAILGAQAFAWDLVMLILISVLIVAGALVGFRLIVALEVVGKLRLAVAVFVLLNLAACIILYALGVPDFILVIVILVIFSFWGLGVYVAADYKKLERGILLFLSCIFAAVLPSLLGYLADLEIWVATLMPIFLAVVCLMNEHVLGNLTQFKCEYTAETQWLLVCILRFPVEIVRIHTAVAVLLHCISTKTHWGPVFLNLFFTFIIEAKFIQFWPARQRLSENEASAPKTLREKLPYTAGQIVIGTGINPWLFRSMAIGPVLEAIMIITHICQILTCGIPAGAGTGPWIGGVALISGCFALREFMVRYVRGWFGWLLIPIVPKLPWDMIRGHHMGLAVGAGMVAASFAQIQYLSRMYVHHWRACFVRSAGSLRAANDDDPAGAVIFVLIGLLALGATLLSFKEWNAPTKSSKVEPVTENSEDEEEGLAKTMNSTGLSSSIKSGMSDTVTMKSPLDDELLVIRKVSDWDEDDKEDDDEKLSKWTDTLTHIWEMANLDSTIAAETEPSMPIQQSQDEDDVGKPLLALDRSLTDHAASFSSTIKPETPAGVRQDRALQQLVDLAGNEEPDSPRLEPEEPPQLVRQSTYTDDEHNALSALLNATFSRDRDSLESTLELIDKLDLGDTPLAESARGHLASLERSAELRELAVKELIAAESARDGPLLRAAISAAKAINVDKGKIAKGEETLNSILEAEAKQQDACILLKQLESSGPSAELQKAIQEAEEVGCPKADLDAARQNLQKLKAAEEQNRIMLQINEALSKKDAHATAELVAKAKRLPGVDSPDITVAEEQLNQLLDDMEVKQAREEAVKKCNEIVAATAGIQDIEELEKFVDQAKTFGASETEIEAPSAKLAEMKRKQAAESAVRSLENAVTSGDIEAAQAALEQAKTTDADTSQLQQFEEKIKAMQAEAEKRRTISEARARLSAALEGGNQAKEAEVVAAIENARAVGLEDAEIMSAESALVTLREQKRKDEARWHLREALALRDPEKIKTQIAAARAAGVEESELAAAEKELQETLDEIERQRCREEAAAKLRTLLATAQVKDIEAVKGAIAEAKACEVEAELLLMAERSLAALQRRAMQEGAVQEMQDALLSQEPKRVEQSIAAAKNAEVDPDKIAQTERQLKELVTEIEVAHDVEQRLKLRIDRASAAASSAKDAKSSKDVSDIIQNELAQLKVAIQEAKEAKMLKKKLIQGAEAILAEETANVRRILEKKILEEKKRAEAKLRSKLDSIKAKNPVVQADLDELLGEIHVAKESDADTRDAEQAHQQLTKEFQQNVLSAQKDVSASLEGGDGEMLTKAIQRCRALVMPDVVKSAIQSAVGLLESKISQARAEADRDTKKKMIAKMDSLMGLVKQGGDERLRRKLHNDIQDLKGAVRVFCRIRPMSQKEIDQGDSNCTEVVDDFTIQVNKNGEKDATMYDAVFAPQASQAEVYNECRQLVQSGADGYNVTIFTYGQTGAGKTWTLYGSGNQPGISPRTCEEIFKVANRDQDRFDFTVKASMLELYLRDLRDLLNNDKRAPGIEIRQHRGSDGSPEVKLENVIEHQVTSPEELCRLVATGLAARKTKATNMNASSSRSHLLLQITVDSVHRGTGAERHGRITIVDLAGSERIGKSGVSGEGAREAIEINKSLTALGDVLMAITSGAKVVPYRNHKLTQLMQDSLGGSAKTLMFVNVSPAASNADETVNALRYATRARCIENDKPSRNPAHAHTPGHAGSR